MIVIERKLSHLTTERPIKVVSVQLGSPFAAGAMETHRYHKWISWRSEEAELARRQKIEAILDTLRTRDCDVLVFPEYSVPESLHNLPMFQAFADAKGCILIPGTFSPIAGNSSFSEHHRSNVSIIYLPNQAPLLIAKKNLHPDEERFVRSRSDIPNLARLIWPISAEKEVSITIFICRDYLKPFRMISDGPSEIFASQLDWTREGLNIVLMESKESNVFLGRAATEIRRLRGPGKVILFANSANNGGELATALIGPAPARKMEFGDVVECIPADKEGVLSSDISLSKVEYTITRPDKITINPIYNTKIDLLLTEGNDTVRLKPLPKHGPKLRRGVWHPALLQYLERKIIIDLYQARNQKPIRESFEHRISSVYAAVIRGYDDIMVRRYDKDITSHLAYPFSNLDAQEQERLFGAPSASISIQPDGILKYRGHKFNRASWAHERKKIDDLLADERTRKTRIDAIATLAEDWDNPQIEESVRLEVSPVFNNRIEVTIPLDQDVQNGIFETYVLIGIADQFDQKSFRELLIERTIEDDSVREIFHPIGTALPFQYLLKLKCNQGKTDEIISGIRQEAENRNFSLGTRTFGVIQYLQKESVTGLADANVAPEVKLFFEELRNVDAEACRALDLKHKTEQFLQLANVHARQRAFVMDLSKELYEEMSDLISAFYCNLYFGNFTTTRSARRRRYLQFANNSYANMFQVLEREAETKMSLVLGAKNRLEIIDLVKERFPKAVSEKTQNEPLDLMLRLPQLFFGNALEEQFRKARSLRQTAADVRNLASHGSMRQYDILDISTSEWEHKWQQITNSTWALLEMILIIDGAKARHD